MKITPTRVFTLASIAFGVFGILAILTSPNEPHGSDVNHLLVKAVQICVIIILTSFALSVAAKYLNGKK